MKDTAEKLPEDKIAGKEQELSVKVILELELFVAHCFEVIKVIRSSFAKHLSLKSLCRYRSNRCHGRCM